MPSLKDLRAQIPELSGLDDDAAVAVIHQAYYPDLELSAVASALGHKAKEPKAEPSGKARRLLGDTGLSLLKGVIGVPEAAVGIGDLVTGGEAGRMAEAAGFRPKEARAMLDELMTPEQKAANAAVQQADGFTGKLGAALTNPSTIGHTIVESLPSIAAGGVVGRGAMALAPRMGAGMAGAIGEGAMAAGQNAEQVRQEDPNGRLTGEQSAILAASGALTGGLSLLGNKVARSLGIGDVDTLLVAGRKAATPAQQATVAQAQKWFVRKVLEGAASEGILEELPQSVQEQVAQNMAQGKPLDENVDYAAVMGLLSGAVMGGAAAPMAKPGDQLRAEGLQPERGPATRALNAAVETAAKKVDADPALAAAASKMAAAAGLEPLQGATTPPGEQATPAAPVATPGRSPEQIDAAMGQMHQQASEDLQATRVWSGKKVPPRTPGEVIGQEPDALAMLQAQADAERRAEQRPDPNDIREAIDETERRNAATRALYAPILPTDILNPKGEPFRNERAANTVAKREGGSVVVVEGGWAVRPKESDAPATGGTAGSASPDAGRGDGTGVLRDGRPADVPVGAAPAAGEGAERPGAAVLRPDGPGQPAAPALTLREQWQAAVARGDMEAARAINEQIVAAKKGNAPVQPAAPEAKPVQAPAPSAPAAPAAAAGAAASPVEAPGVTQGGPGSDAGNGFKHGPKKGERYRVGAVAAAGGALVLEKRLPAGTSATFYVGKDGNFIDSDNVNFIGSGRENLWIPESKEAADRATAILDELGRLELTDPKRKEAKERLKALVTSAVGGSVEAPGVTDKAPAASSQDVTKVASDATPKPAKQPAKPNPAWDAMPAAERLDVLKRAGWTEGSKSTQRMLTLGWDKMTDGQRERVGAAMATAPAAPAQEQVAQREDDYLKALFGADAATINADPFKALESSAKDGAAKQKADAERIRGAIGAEKKRAQASYDDWSGRTYKRNRTQVDLRGDGPSNQASMSIGAINEGRRRNAMDALSKEIAELDKFAKVIESDAGAAQVVERMQALYERASKIASEGTGLFKTADEQFQYMLLDDLKFRGPSGKGNVTSNGLSKAVLSAVKPAPAAPSSAAPTTQGEGNGQEVQAQEALKGAEREVLRDGDGGVQVNYRKGNAWVSVTIRPDRNDVLSADMSKFGGDDIGQGTGIATRAYIDAFETLSKDRRRFFAGFASETVQSDRAVAMYERLIDAGMPFERGGLEGYPENAYTLTQKALQDIDFDAVRAAVAKNATSKRAKRDGQVQVQAQEALTPTQPTAEPSTATPVAESTSPRDRDSGDAGVATGQGGSGPARESAADIKRRNEHRDRLRSYWDGTATPAIRAYLRAFDAFGADRLERNRIKPDGMSAREWLESFVSRQSTWDKGRKTGQTGIQYLSIKDLWPTDDGHGEQLRKAALEAVKALKNAPGSTSELLAEAFMEPKPSAPTAPATHKDPGEPAEPVTPAVVKEAITKAAKREEVSPKQMLADALRLIDEAIATAPTAAEAQADAKKKEREFDDKTRIDVPGDGTFTMVNTKERLREFRDLVQKSPGFTGKYAKPRIEKAVSSGNLSANALAREMLDEGEPLNALEVLDAAGTPMMFGRGRDGEPLVYTDVSPVEIGGDAGFFAGQHWHADKKKRLGWAVIDTSSGMAAGTGVNRAAAVSVAQSNMKRDNGREVLEKARAEAGDGRQDELRAAFIKSAEQLQQGTFVERDRIQAQQAAFNAKERERDAFYRSIMGDEAKRPQPGPTSNGWRPEDVKPFLSAAEKAGKAGEAIDFIRDVLSQASLDGWGNRVIGEWEKANTNTFLSTQFGQPIDLKKPPHTLTWDEVEASVRANTYIPPQSQRAEGMLNQWRTAHMDAVKAALDRGWKVPDRVLYDYRGLVRNDLNDEDADLAADAMVTTYQQTKDYGRAVQAYRDWKPGVDLKGFEQSKSKGGFTLDDGDVTVLVEKTKTWDGKERFQARLKNSTTSSGPNLTEQQAIDWAANLRDDMRKAEPAQPQAAAPAQPAATSATTDAQQAAPKATSAPVSTVEGQKTLAYRGSRIASLLAMNEQIRKLDPSEAWHPDNINDATDLDALQDSISSTLVRLQRQKAEKNAPASDTVDRPDIAAIHRDKTLDKQTSENGEVMTRRQWVERKVAEGLKPQVKQEDRIKPMSRMQFFRATNEEQRAHERKIKEAGKKDVYWIGDYEVTKTEHDYAVSLAQAQAAPSVDPSTMRLPPTETATERPSIGQQWDAMNTDQRNAVAAEAGWRTAKGGVNPQGRAISRQGWDALVDSTRKRLGDVIAKRGAESAGPVGGLEAENDRDHFTLERGTASNTLEKVTFARGEYVEVSLVGSNKKVYGEIDGISHAKREFSVDGLWHPFGAAYKAERPAPPKKDTVPMSSVIDSVNKKHGQGLTDADRVPDQAPASKTPTVDAHLELFKAVRAGTAAPDDFKAMYRRVRDGKDAIVAELNTSTKDELLKDISGYIRPGTTKGELVDLIYTGLLRRFALGKEYGPNSYMMGQEKAYQKAKQDALDALVEGQTAESLAEYAAAAKAEFDAEVARRAALVESVKDPKTLEDFRRYIRVKESEGKTFAEARMMLTPEQRALMDDLAATETRSRRTTAQDEQRTQVRVAGQTVDGDIIATKHTKKGHDLFVVKLSERVSREDYDTLNAGAKRIGGYYSSFRGGGAIPGFQFTTREQAEAFVKLAGGDNTAAHEAAQVRRDAYADDRSQTAAERLTEMADRMEADADESLAMERKANTARRARFAASAEQAARESKATAKTMRNIAQALTAGTAKFLDRIRTKTQVALLQTYVANAKDAELRAKYPSYAEQEKRKGQPPTAETADYAEFPTFTAFRSDLASLGRQLLEVDGTKKLGERLMKVADDVTDAFTAWVKEPGNFYRVGIYSNKEGGRAAFTTKDGAERAIARSGYRGKAIPWSIKRGEWTVIMSPSEAIARQLWKGDGDKRITLSAEFGAELVEGIGRAAKRGNRVNDRLNAPWQFERAYERRKQLSRMGLETPAEFRAALREFIGLREQAAEADRVKALERAMVGRAKDGLDFFPTPESVADEMIAAADIKPEMSVLEPSAGMGHIADRIRAAGAEPDVIELSNDRRELLQEKGYYVQPYNDFLQMELRSFYTFGDVMRAPDGVEGIMHGGRGWSGRASLHEINPDGTEGRMLGWYDRAELVGVRQRGPRGNDAGGYDRIIMNPPFSDGRDIEHVRHAYTLLKPGGRLVALMGESAFTNQNKRATEFREWLESVGGTDEKLAEGSFMDPSLPVNTGAHARMVVIEKPEGGAALSRSTTTGPRIDLASAQALAEKLAGDGLLKLNVVQSSADLPPRLLAQLSKSAPDGRVRGVYFRSTDQVWLVADHIRGADEFVEVALHEAFHRGLGRLIPGVKPVLNEIWRTNQSVRKATAEQMRTHGIGRDEAIEEALAKMAEAGTVRDLKGWPKLLEAIRSWLGKMARAVGIEMTWTDDMVADLVAAATREGLRGGVHVIEAEADLVAAKRAPTVTVDTDEATGAPVYATDDITIGFPQETERFEYVLNPGEKLVNYSIGPADGFDSYGFVELVIGADGVPKALADIEIKPELRGQAIGEKVMEALLGAHPGVDIEISNIVEGARGFWSKMGIPEQNRAAGEAYDGTLNYETFRQAQDDRSANRAAAGRGEAGQGRDAAAEGGARGAGEQAQGLMLSRADPADMRAAPVLQQIQQRASDLLTTQRTFNWWHRTVGTQFHKARIDSDFGRVFNAAQDYLHDTSAFANDPADLAPDLLPQLKHLADLKKSLTLKKDDREKLAGAVFEGTLNFTRDDSGTAVEAGPDDTPGVVWTPDELRERFGFNDQQVKLYQQARAAIDRSLDTLVASDVARLFGEAMPAPVRTLVSSGDLGRFRGIVTALTTQKLEAAQAELADVRKRQRTEMAAFWKKQKAALEGPQGRAGTRHATITALEQEKAALQSKHARDRADAEAEAAKWAELQRTVAGKYERIGELKARGYAPLQRFGRYTLDVVGEDGTRKFFGLYESEAEANAAARAFREAAEPGDQVSQGVLSEEAYKQFQGMTPETLELFAEVAGVEKNEVFQEYLRRAKNNRSALKRLIHRKGVAGYSEDTSRVLAQFIVSNARAASTNLHVGEIGKAIQDIPKEKGDVIDEAIRLREYVQTPQEEAQAIRALLFAQYLGGSVASAMVNLTQPLMMTFPYLSQFGGMAAAVRSLTGAMKAALGSYDRGSDLGKALALAEKEGIVSPQELHQLQAEASGALARNPGLRRALFAWGSLFSAAEQFNRRLSFIASFNMAKDRGMDDPAGFAARAVEETQGVYNKGNKPRWARGAVGGTLFTFKQYSVSYMEFLKRLPTRERTLALAVLLLAAGAQGMPGADDLDDIIDTLGQGLGYDTNAKLWKTRVLSDAIGDDGADFVLRGFSALPGFPLDVAGRLGLGNLIPGTGLLLKSKTDKAGEVAEALGPVASTATGAARAIQAAAGGNVGGVLEGIAPKGIKDLAKALEMYQTGEYRDTKGRKVTAADTTDALVKSLGFQPAPVARDSRRVQMANQQIALARVTETEIADAIARARVDGKPEDEQAARQRLARWNEVNPESRIVVTPMQIIQRVRQLRTSRDERFVRAAPREMRQAVTGIVQ